MPDTGATMLMGGDKAPARFVAFLRGVTGWRRASIAVLFGALTALAYAPINFFVIVFLSFPALIYLLQGAANWRQAFITGWCFAFGAFAAGFYWIAASMFVDLAQFWWAIPLSVAGLPTFFGLYYGMAAVAARRLGLKGVGGATLFALCWFLADVARGHVFGGFPWNLEGYIWTGTVPMLQSVSLFGVYGLTLVTLVVACLPASLVVPRKHNMTAVIAGFAFLAALGLWGVLRLHDASDAMQPDIRLRIVQPNIAQNMKWVASEQNANFEHLLRLTSVPEADDKTPMPNLIIWPETASTFYLFEDEEARHAITNQLTPGATLITGVVRHDRDAKGERLFYNSMAILDDKGHILGSYDKSHLVPFGEYIPLRQWLPIHSLVQGIDFSSGRGAETFHVGKLPGFSPFICYEAIFPHDLVDEHNRPQWLLNITNDGWYGQTSGPYQHFSIVITRAVEEGLPLIRAANTGISGIVDPYGRVRSHLGLGRSGLIEGRIPVALPATLYARLGDVSYWAVFTILAVTALVASFSRHLMRLINK